MKHYETEEFLVDDSNASVLIEAPNNSQSIQDLLRDNNYKIKNILYTSFGDEIILAKKYEQKRLKELLSNFKVQYKGNSIFVVK